MVMNAFNLLILFSVTIILGYIGSIIFEKTKIPDVIWLMGLGLIVGPIFKLVDTNLFISMSLFMSAIALIIILYDAGLNMNFYQLIRGVPRSGLLAVLNILFSMFAVGYAAKFFLGLDLITGMLLGAILGGTSSPIILTIVEGLKIKGNTRTFIELESIITDPLCIVVSIALIDIIVSGLPLMAGIQNIFSAFSIAIVLGLVAGVIWLTFLDKLRGRQFDYMLTLAVIFLLYVFTETVGGSGAISALSFGIVLGNARIFSRIFKLSKLFSVDKVMKKFHTEISFFIRSFFFVYIGLILSIKQEFIIYGVGISLILILIRFAAVHIATIGMGITKLELNMVRVLSARGLAAAVLAQLPRAYGVPGSDFFSNIVFTVIVVSVIYTSFSTMYFFRDRDNKTIKQ
ncbi:MAG: cation:proton antiporter [Candidatus Aenigmarchaeota archaeon]|nr:cation:proton antiporter [Candidatus Aenigmarchaeota archaeon]